MPCDINCFSMQRKVKSLSNYQYFLRLDTTPYKGEWIAISQKKVVSHGKDAQEVYNRAKKKVKRASVSLAKVPEEQVLVLPVFFPEF